MKILVSFIVTAIFTYFSVAIFFIHRSTEHLPLITPPIYFESSSGAFTYRAVPAKGSDAAAMEAAFTTFKAANPQYAQDQIYRLSPINYFNLDRWMEYRTRPEWKYPFRWKFFR
ncbi:MAG: hypothetical protein AAFQ92_21880 [Bacteroidota bacterium]